MSNKLTFEERWEKFRLEKLIPCETFVSKNYGFIEELEEFVNQETGELKKKVEELAASAYSLAKENESLKKKLEKADFLARAFAKECQDSEKARAYLKEELR